MSETERLAQPPRGDGIEFVELRGPAPRATVDVLDAVQMTDPQRWRSRMDLVNEILADWVARKVHEARVITRVTRGNGRAPDSLGNGEQT